MSKERSYKSYINKNGVLETLPKEQGSFDELMTEIQEEPLLTESTNGRPYSKIGKFALAEAPTQPSA